MSEAEGIAGVLAEHGEQQTVCECALGPHTATIGCDCGEWDDSTETYDAHVAAAVLDHLRAVAADEETREVVADAIFAATDSDLRKRLEDANWVEGYDSDYADAAVNAYLGVLGGEA